MRQEVIQQDIPLSMKLRLVLYFSPWISFSTLHLYSPTSLAELIVKLNNAGIKSVLFKVDTFWLALNSVYLRGGEPESEWQERLTFWFNITSKVPWTGVRMGLESISGKKKLLSELIAPIIQESLPPSPPLPPPLFFSLPRICWGPGSTYFCWNRCLCFLLLPVAGNATSYFSVLVYSL